MSDSSADIRDVKTIARGRSKAANSAIWAFLGDVGRRLARDQVVRSVLWIIAAAALVAVVAPLLSASAPKLAGALSAIAVLATAAAFFGVILSVWFAKRHWNQRETVARYVGSQHQPIASDLLSAVEFAESEHPEFSRELLEALNRSAATQVGILEPAQLVPLSRLKRPLVCAAAAAGVFATAFFVAPKAMAKGWANMAGSTLAAPFEGATLTTGPVVGDVEIRLTFPSYTNRAEVVLPAAAGDFRAMPGTIANIRTVALHRASSAQIVFGQVDSTSERDPIELKISEQNLETEFTVESAEIYRFLIKEPGGNKRVEAVGHRIELERDNAPEVELHAPADELDVSNQKRVELAYIATDDYGITKVELVWDANGKTQRRELPLAEQNRPSAQSKLVWDLSEVELPSGGAVPYHIEVSDNDVVSGPNIGKSKAFSLRVFSPRERHEGLVDDQRKLFEKFITLLGGRLTSDAEDLGAHRGLQRATSEIVVDLGTLANALGEDKLASKDLATFLSELRTRYDEFAKDERTLLTQMQNRSSQKGGKSTRKLENAVAALNIEQITALEDDVIAMISWIDRQDLEGMLHIADEIKTHRERLDKLMTELARTGDPAIREEIERELRNLENKLAELGKKSSGMQTDVLDQFVNRDAAQADQRKGCLVKVRERLAAGDDAGAAEQMKKCSDELEKSSTAMEQALAGLRSDRFSDEQKEIAELMNSLSDLAQDEDDLAKAIDDVYDDYADKAAELSAKESSGKKSKLSKPAEALRKRLENISEAALTPFGKEELEVVKARVKDLKKMINDGDFAEALAMSRQAEAGLESLAAELEADIEDGQPWNKRTPQALAESRKAQLLAQKLTDSLRTATPAPRDVMDSSARKRLARLLEKQKKLRQRGKQVGRRATGAKHLPPGVGDKVAEKLGQADGKMDGVQRRLRATDPSGARHQAHEAADFLRQLTKDTQRQTRGGQAQGRTDLRDEPVRIPGAEEYKAPAKLREELLEAMKKGGPSSYEEMNKRYYEELIK